jgi:hypothetical protein
MGARPEMDEFLVSRLVSIPKRSLLEWLLLTQRSCLFRPIAFGQQIGKQPKADAIGGLLSAAPVMYLAV